MAEACHTLRSGAQALWESPGRALVPASAGMRAERNLLRHTVHCGMTNVLETWCRLAFQGAFGDAKVTLEHGMLCHF